MEMICLGKFHLTTDILQTACKRAAHVMCTCQCTNGVLMKLMYVYMTVKICIVTSSSSSFHQASSNTETAREGVTQGMSLKGSQTGNTGRCCQDVSVCMRLYLQQLYSE